jgi:hypothetical protein
MIGVNEMTTTDHLYTHPWVNEFGRDAAVVHPRMFRNTFSTHPAKKTPLPFTLVVCHENHSASRKNYLLSSLGSGAVAHGDILTTYGNILVIKRRSGNPREVMDVNPADVDLITEVLLR